MLLFRVAYRCRVFDSLEQKIEIAICLKLGKISLFFQMTAMVLNRVPPFGQFFFFQLAWMRFLPLGEILVGTKFF